MKKKFIFAFGIVLALIAILVTYVPERYQIPFTPDDVDYVSFYWLNNKEMKQVSLPTDISSICESVDGIYLWGEYSSDRVEDGGQSFVLAFRLTNGKNWTLTYFQPNRNSGYLSDGEIKNKASNFELNSMWDSLDYPIVYTKPEDDGIAFPPLF